MINNMLQTDETQFMQEIKKEQEELVLNNSTLYKYVSFEGACRILTDNTLAFRNPQYLNDPFDCTLELMDFSRIPPFYRENLFKKYYSHLTGENKIRMQANFESKPDTELLEILVKGMQQDLDKRGITCFSKSYDNMLMWSHYADSHKGICIGFNLPKLYTSIRLNSHPERFMISVKYDRQFDSINYFSHPAQAVINWLRTKSEDWAYEKEVRLVLYDLSFNEYGLHLQGIPGDCIKEVYLGCRIFPDHEIAIKRLIAERCKHVTIQKLSLVRGKFELRAQ
jgi:hypothetical protein